MSFSASATQLTRRNPADYFYSAAEHRSRGALWPIFAPARRRNSVQRQIQKRALNYLKNWHVFSFARSRAFSESRSHKAQTFALRFGDCQDEFRYRFPDYSGVRAKQNEQRYRSKCCWVSAANLLRSQFDQVNAESRAPLNPATPHQDSVLYFARLQFAGRFQRNAEHTL